MRKVYHEFWIWILIMNRNVVKQYFEENSSAWMHDAYENSGHNYQTPAHRLRILTSFLDRTKGIASAVDLGCGGGKVTLEMARRGIHVTAVDEAAAMIRTAQELFEAQPEEIRQRISLVQSDLMDWPMQTSDCVAAMGLIGYLKNDDMLFRKAAAGLNKGGYFIVSFRNRLFNIFSISHRTINEVRNGAFEELVAEADALYQSVDPESVTRFLQALQEASSQCSARPDMPAPAQKAPTPDYSGSVEARQSTPQQAIAAGEEHGFSNVGLFGVHPHILTPGLNRLLPPGVYNTLSNALIPFESHPLALLWSSAFIGIFQKR